MKKNVFIALCALLFFALALFPAGASAQMRGRQGPFIDRENFLNLTPEQKDKLKELRKAHMELRQSSMEKMEKLRQNLRELMADSKANEKKMGSLFDDIAKLRAEQMKTNLHNQVEMRKVLTPEQLEKLDSAKKRIQRFRGQRQMMAFHQGRLMRGQGRFLNRGIHRPWGRGLRNWRNWR